MVNLVMFFDGQCPVCTRTKDLVQSGARGRVGFVDIRAPDFIPQQYNRTLDQFAGTLHVLDLMTGQWFVGPDAVRKIDAVAGTGLAEKLSRVPFFDKIFNAAYNWMNRNRYRF